MASSAAAGNGIVGALPDNFDDTSPLQGAAMLCMSGFPRDISEHLRFSLWGCSNCTHNSQHGLVLRQHPLDRSHQCKHAYLCQHSALSRSP